MPTVILAIRTTKGNIVEVEGKRIVLPGFEAFSFIIHRSIESRSKWTITEETTLLSMSSDYERRTSQKDTISATLKRLVHFNVTPAILQKQIDIQLKHQARINKRK